MIDSIRIYHVKPSRMTEFVAAFRKGGMWHELARSLPGFVATDLLESRELPQAFLSIDFWETEDACMRAQDSHQARVLAQLLSDVTISTVNLGIFAFPREAIEVDANEGDFVSSVLRRVERWVRL